MLEISISSLDLRFRPYGTQKLGGIHDLRSTRQLHDSMGAVMSALTSDWEQLRERTRFVPRRAVLELAVNLSRDVPGDIIEFGVAKGDSTRVLRRAAKGMKKRIFACDSFEGLREKFENADIGSFATTPPRIQGVEIVKGYYEDSLTPGLATRVGKVALASLDADLYSSTLCALRWLKPLLGSGSLLLFDEFVGENESEKRAFEDWSRESGTQTIAVAEFLRDPSGWGDTVDKRLLYQVVGEGTLPRQRASMRERLRSSWAGTYLRSARNLLKK